MGPGDGDARRLKDAVNGNPTSGTLYLGTSGFYYDHWVGVLYPEEMRRRDWLKQYCQHFGTVEINASYYHMPRAKVCASWRERTPPGFRFTMKMNGDITHRRRLAGFFDLRLLLDPGEFLPSLVAAVVLDVAEAPLVEDVLKLDEDAAHGSSGEDPASLPLALGEPGKPISVISTHTCTTEWRLYPLLLRACEVGIQSTGGDRKGGVR